MAKNIYQNRELSWLKFNERVLMEGANSATPLLERLKFISIFDSNLDEFFMIRVGSLFDRTLMSSDNAGCRTGMSVEKQLSSVFAQVKALIPKRDKIFDEVNKGLAELGIKKIEIKELSDEEKKKIEKYFVSEILPLTSPLVIDAVHPFPFLRNKSVYVGFSISSKADKGEKNQKKKFGLIPIVAPLERIVHLPHATDDSYCLIEDLVMYFAEKIFKKYKIHERFVFRITRNADISVDEALFDYDLDFRTAMSEILKNRRKLAPVRLQIKGNAGEDSVKQLQKRLALTDNQIFFEKSPLGLSYAFELMERVKAKKNLFYKELVQANLDERITPKDLIAYIRKRDVLFAYPYQSTRPFIAILRSLADDPDVVSIKITLYRVAQSSRIISALIKAAENGKDVVVVVELRARFDEENNINWSQHLEEAGATVIYGMPGYKVHSKLLLITRKQGKEIEYLTHVGTGNYNEQTAKLYTDFSLLTMNKEIGSEVSMIFNDLAMGELTDDTKHMLIAPNCLKSRIITLIDTEIACARAGEAARIVIKCNSISDKAIIDKLIEASNAGVKILLFIRGICCFKPGVLGQTENIVVKSVVGRLLEHSRVYIFGTKERQKMYISSADFMTRNTQNRVEVAVPIYDLRIQEMILKMIEYMDKDNVKARILLENGDYANLPSGSEAFDSQVHFYALFDDWTKELSKEILTSKALSVHPEKGRKRLFRKKS